MTLAELYEQYKNDYASFPDIEDVTYTDSDGAQASVKARKCITTQKELERAGDYGSQLDIVTFVLWHSTLGGKSVVGNGTITRANGEVYTVQSVLGRERFETQWRCLAIIQL